MYFVGIDISKYKHDCFISTETGQVIKENLSFNNNDVGFSQLLCLLKSLDNNQEIRIGFEATGHYSINLKLFLEKNNYSFMEFNPFLVKKFASGLTLRRTKTDKVDAFLIAKYLMSIEYKPHPKQFYHKYSLKSLTRLREKLVKQRSYYLVQLTNILDIIFPEFKPFFDNDFSVASLFILNKYKSTDKISNMKDFDSIRKVSRGHFKYPNFIKIIEDKISDIIKELNPKTLSIRGIGITSCATIISEFGDISRFKSPDAMLSFAGLEPSVIQSGISDQKGKMVKHGSGHLRYSLLNVASYVVVHEPIFTVYYYKKINEGKIHRVALNHVAKKLIRIIYKLETENIEFDSSKLR